MDIANVRYEKKLNTIFTFYFMRYIPPSFSDISAKHVFPPSQKCIIVNSYKSFFQ